MMTAIEVSAALSQVEQRNLADHEAIIERGLKTFYEVGTALAEIRDQRLYRADYGTFEDYCRERWGMSRRNVDRLVEAAGVINDLRPMGLIPTSERQARPLAAVPAEQRAEVWQEAVETAPNGKVTGAHVEAVVETKQRLVAEGIRQELRCPDLNIGDLKSLNDRALKITGRMLREGLIEEIDARRDELRQHEAALERQADEKLACRAMEKICLLAQETQPEQRETIVRHARALARTIKSKSMRASVERQIEEAALAATEQPCPLPPPHPDWVIWRDDDGRSICIAHSCGVRLRAVDDRAATAEMERVSRWVQVLTEWHVTLGPQGWHAAHKLYGQCEAPELDRLALAAWRLAATAKDLPDLPDAVIDSAFLAGWVFESEVGHGANMRYRYLMPDGSAGNFTLGELRYELEMPDVEPDHVDLSPHAGEIVVCEGMLWRVGSIDLDGSAALTSLAPERAGQPLMRVKTKAVLPIRCVNRDDLLDAALRWANSAAGAMAECRDMAEFDTLYYACHNISLEIDPDNLQRIAAPVGTVFYRARAEAQERFSESDQAIVREIREALADPSLTVEELERISFRISHHVTDVAQRGGLLDQIVATRNAIQRRHEVTPSSLIVELVEAADIRLVRMIAALELIDVLFCNDALLRGAVIELMSHNSCVQDLIDGGIR